MVVLQANPEQMYVLNIWLFLWQRYRVNGGALINELHLARRWALLRFIRDVMIFLMYKILINIKPCNGYLVTIET